MKRGASALERVSARGLWLALVLVPVLAACKGEPRTKPVIATGSGSGSSARIVADPPPDPRLASLPGELWFVEDEPEHTLVRVVAGTRTEIKAPLFPSTAKLPDGRLVAIRSRGDGSPDSEQLVLVAADGTQTPVGPSAPQVRDPVADATSIIAALQLEGRSDLHRIDLATGAAKRLTDNKEGNFRPVRLGADSIVFVSSRDGDSEIYRMPIAGGAPTRLTAFHKDDWDPAPSPDGTTIAFTSDRAGSPKLFLIAADGTAFRRLGRVAPTEGDRELEESSAQWSPDGTRIAYLQRHQSRSMLAIRTLDSSVLYLTPSGASDAEPVWSPDGAWLAVVRTVGRDSQLVVIPTDRMTDTSPIVVSRGAAQLPRWFK